jgi:hypothetical protein
MNGKMVPVNPNSMVPVTTNQIMMVGYDTMDSMFFWDSMRLAQHGNF